MSVDSESVPQNIYEIPVDKFLYYLLPVPKQTVDAGVTSIVEKLGSKVNILTNDGIVGPDGEEPDEIPVQDQIQSIIHAVVEEVKGLPGFHDAPSNTFKMCCSSDLELPEGSKMVAAFYLPEVAGAQNRLEFLAQPCPRP